MKDKMFLVISILILLISSSLSDDIDQDEIDFDKLKAKLFDPDQIDSIILNYKDMLKAHGTQDHALVEIRALQRHFKNSDNILNSKQYEAFLIDVLESLHEDVDPESTANEEHTEIRKVLHQK